MSLRSSLLAFIVFCFAATSAAQEVPRWNFNIGGGPGFPLTTAADFANTAYTLRSEAARILDLTSE